MKIPRVLLFDLDGVLIRPGGYRAAVRATVNHFTSRWGLGDLAPGDETVAIFEAQGITCEWDMVPLLLAAVLESAAVAAPVAPELASLEAAETWARSLPAAPAVDFPPLLRRLGAYVRPGESPADSILAACQDGQAGTLFPRLARQGVLAELLSGTRRLERSRTTQVFELFAIGDEAYARLSGLPAPARCESLLARHDEPLLAPSARARLLALRQRGRLRFAAYTARPSLPVREPGELLAAFSPEAEMALRVIGIEPFPLIGSGQTGESARRLDEKDDRLTKPSPYHALAAVIAAWTGDRAAALDWMEQAFCFFERGAAGQPDPRLLPARLALHVFEDAPSGMRGAIRAAELLRALGVETTLELWGVSTHVEKIAALAATGARVFPDVNQALDAALGGAL